MLAVIHFLLFASVLVDAAPFERRATSQIISNCNHDFSYTWDDGPYKSHNEINEIFASANSHTTFYINGDNWSCIYEEDNVQALRASYEAGHQLAHHTWSHPDLTTLSNAQIDVEIGRLNDAFIRILGVKPKFFRPPYGSITEPIAAYIQEKFGLTVVVWSDDSLDSDGKNTEEWNYDFYTGLANQGNSSPHMTLSHETIPGSVQALGNGTVTNLKAANINLVTTATCLDQEPYETVTGYYGTRDASWTCNGAWVPGNFPGQSSSSSPSSLKISTSTTPTLITPASASTTDTANPTCRWYSPSSAMTCDQVGTANGVSGLDIKAANSFVNCDDIWAGTWLCIPSGTPVTTPSTTPSPATSTVTSSCTSWYSTTLVTTCDAVGVIYGVSGDAIKALNSFVDCADIWAGTVLCVPASSPTSPVSPPPTPSCASTYVSASGDTCDTIAGMFSLAKSDISNANTFLNCEDIWTGTSICIPKAATSSCSSTYTSVLGDTCKSIATEYGLQESQISNANSYLNCADIWSGSPICIPLGGHAASVSQCTKTIDSKTGDNCDTIAQANGVSKDQIVQWNSFLNCSDIWNGTPVCVAHS